MDLKSFIHQLEESISITKDIGYISILNMLIKYYSKISDQVEIIGLYIGKNSHSLEISMDKSFYFEIDVNKNSIHLIINRLEEIFFFDDDWFKNYQKKVLDSLFEGDYNIIEYTNKSLNSYYSLKFTEESLNRKEQYLKGNVTRISPGKRLLN